MYLKFIRVVKYDEDSIWMFTRLKSPMKRSLQVVFSKSDSKESQIIARREVREETGLELSQMLKMGSQLDSTNYNSQFIIVTLYFLYRRNYAII